jgi:hypothetical protein
MAASYANGQCTWRTSKLGYTFRCPLHDRVQYNLRVVLVENAVRFRAYCRAAAENQDIFLWLLGDGA